MSLDAPVEAEPASSAPAAEAEQEPGIIVCEEIVPLNSLASLHNPNKTLSNLRIALS